MDTKRENEIRNTLNDHICTTKLECKIPCPGDDTCPICDPLQNELIKMIESWERDLKKQLNETRQPGAVEDQQLRRQPMSIKDSIVEILEQGESLINYCPQITESCEPKCDCNEMKREVQAQKIIDLIKGEINDLPKIVINTAFDRNGNMKKAVFLDEVVKLFEEGR